MSQPRHRTLKSGRFALVLALSLSATLSLNAQSAPAVPSGVPPAVTAAFSEVRAQRTTVAGEYLLRIAEAAYGNKLLWPLVWVFNAQSLPDPEKVPLGSRLTVARLERELTDPLVVKALDEAYRLVWLQYAKVHAGDRDKSRWILGQAVQAGVDVTSPAWAAILGEQEMAYVKTLKVMPAVHSAPSAIPIETLLTKAQHEKFLTNVLEGIPLTGTEMETFSQFLGTTDGAPFLTRLEESSWNPEAPPHVAYVLALHYGRLGMKAQEYRSLIQARTQADRRPNIVFNLMLVHSRMAMLRSDKNIEDLLPSSITVTSEPSGATVTVEGEVWGKTPLTRDGLRPGTFEMILITEGYKPNGQTVTLDLGEHREVRGDMVALAVNLEGTVNDNLHTVGGRGPSGGWIVLDKGQVTNGWRYLEVAENDLGSLTHSRAIAACNTYSAGAVPEAPRANVWRLPTTQELKIMIGVLVKNGIGNFKANSYWTSEVILSRGGEVALDVYMAQTLTGEWGAEGQADKGLRRQVRPVRQL